MNNFFLSRLRNLSCKYGFKYSRSAAAVGKQFRCGNGRWPSGTDKGVQRRERRGLCLIVCGQPSNTCRFIRVTSGVNNFSDPTRAPGNVFAVLCRSSTCDESRFIENLSIAARPQTFPRDLTVPMRTICGHYMYIYIYYNI